MKYLLIDTHKRPIGTLISDKSFSVGDTFQSHDAGMYTVVGLNWFQERTHAPQSLTVIPRAKAKVVAEA